MELQVQNDYGTLSLKGKDVEFEYEQIKKCKFRLNGKNGYIRCTGGGMSYGHGYSIPYSTYSFITEDFELLTLNHLNTVINLEPDKITVTLPTTEHPIYERIDNILEVNAEDASFSYEIKNQ